MRESVGSAAASFPKVKGERRLISVFSLSLCACHSHREAGNYLKIAIDLFYRVNSDLDREGIRCGGNIRYRFAAMGLRSSTEFNDFIGCIR